MKKILSLLLVTCLFSILLLSCSPTEELYVSGNIIATSASASGYASWLDERLGDISQSIVVGIGNTEEHGVDLTNFEDDGYIIRSEDKLTVIFGKTETGLDLAVRKFANDTELYGSVDNIIYHEGLRIDFLSLFGIPIRNFAIEYHSNTAKVAAQELSRLIEIACGMKLAAVPGYSGCPNVIVLKSSDDDSLKNNGFRYFENDGSLFIEGDGDNGCLMGVYYFLENELGWDGLLLGDSSLADNHTLDVPAGIDTTVVPAFDFVAAHPDIEKSFATDRSFPIYSYSPSAEDIFSEIISDEIICFSSEKLFRSVVKCVLDFAENNDTAMIDLSPLTRGNFCTCDKCTEFLETDGGTFASAVRFFNRLAEELQDDFPDITYRFTVTDNTTAPSAIEPNNKLHIAFTLDKLCVNHSIGSVPYNHECSSALESWLALTDNVSVIFTKDSEELHQYTLIHTLYEKINYLYSVGVKGIYFDAPYNGLGIERIEYSLIDLMSRSIDMTEEEFEIQLGRLLKKEYGLGSDHIREYIRLWTDAEDIAGCIISADDIADATLTLQNFDQSVALFNDAARFAESSFQSDRCYKLSCHMYFNECRAAYFPEYFAGNADGITLIENCYSSLLDVLHEIGITPHHSDLYSVAWHEWVCVKDKLYSGEEDFSPSKDYLDFTERASSNTGDGKFTFAFKTDTHFTFGNSVSALKNFANIQRYIPLDLYVHGGDLINGNHPDEPTAVKSLTTAYNSMLTLHSAPFVSIKGNHDDNSWTFYGKTGSKYGVFPEDGIIDTSEWIDYAFTNSSKIVTDGKSSYGYFDHDESKIRVLFVDTSDLPYVADEDGMYYYGAYTGNGLRNDQLNFMAKAMTFEDKGDDGKNWAVIIVSHVPIEGMKNNDSYRFGGKDAPGRNFFVFLRIVEAYKNGTAVNLHNYYPTNYGDAGYENGDVIGDFSYSVKADFSKNGPGEVIGFFSGHTHIDNYSNRVGYGSYTNQVMHIYPELTTGYSYFSFSSDGFSVITVDRNGDGTGTISVDKYNSSVVTSQKLISDGDNARVTSDPIMKNIHTSDPVTGSIASGSYTVTYSQPPKRK